MSIIGKLKEEVCFLCGNPKSGYLRIGTGEELPYCEKHLIDMAEFDLRLHLPKSDDE
jgi:hypothetical protein